MGNVEHELKNKKVEIDNIEIPDELENRLRAALNCCKTQEAKTRIRAPWLVRRWALTAALVFVVLFGAMNYDVFAYYGKKILGYDEITYGSMKDLNYMGMGQEINKAYTFKNGTVVSLDGVMLDDNKLAIMYSVKGINEEAVGDYSVEPLTGYFGRYYMRSGQGIFNEEKDEVRWVQEYETPWMFDRSLTFNIMSRTDDVSKGEIGRISFKLDMNKAIKRTVKCDINKTVDFQGMKYNFTSLSATPMSVVIEGNIELSSENDRKLFTSQDLMGTRRNLHVELLETYIKDGKTETEILQGGISGMSSSMEGITFKYEFDGLKPDIKQLELNIVKFEDMREIDKTIDIGIESKNIRVVPETEELIVTDVREEGGNTIVTFDTEKDIAFGSALMIGGNQAKELDKTIKVIEGSSGRAIVTYRFQGYGEKMQLLFKTISHETYINKVIVISSEA